MDRSAFFKDLFEPIPDYRRITLLMLIVEKDNDLLYENVFLNDDVECLLGEFENLFNEQKEDSLDYVKHAEKSINEKSPKKLNENFFESLFEDARLETPLKSLLSLRDEGI